MCKWESQFDSGLTAGAELDMTADEIAEINTSIGTTGNRLANFLKSMALKLGLIADYVVEQGTSGIWTYEKWNSGKIRMTGRTSTTIYALSWTAVGNVFYATIESRNFPFTLQSVTYFNWYIQNADAGYIFFPLSNPNNYGGVTTSSTGAVAAGRPTKPNWNLDIDLFYEVEGTWK